MKNLFFISGFIFLLIGCVDSDTDKINIEILNTDSSIAEKPISYSGFEFHYQFSGLGSNMGEMFPVFNIIGTHYIYTKEQNSSWTGKFDKEKILVSEGDIRKSSIDSILVIVNAVQDSVIYDTNAEIMSGGIHYISTKNDSVNLEITLYNGSDSNAVRIIEIINSNLPKGVDKLWLYDF